MNGCKVNSEFYVVPFVARSILGLDSLMKLNLVTPTVPVQQVPSNSSKTVGTSSHSHSHQFQIGNFITRNRSHMLPDKTGRGFFVSHDQVFDALQTPTPAPDPPKTCNPRPISQTVLMPEGNRPTASKFLNTPPPTKKVITIPIKKSTMPPEIVDKYRAMSNMCYDKWVGGVVVSSLAYHAGGRGFKSRIRQP